MRLWWLVMVLEGVYQVSLVLLIVFRLQNLNPDPTSSLGGRANAFLGGAPATTLQRLRPSSRCLRRLDLACRDPYPAAKVIKRRKCLICKHPLSRWRSHALASAGLPEKAQGGRIGGRSQSGSQNGCVTNGGEQKWSPRRAGTWADRRRWRV